MSAPEKSPVRIVAEALATHDVEAMHRKPNEFVSFKATGTFNADGIPQYKGSQTLLQSRAVKRKADARLALRALRAAGYRVTK